VTLAPLLEAEHIRSLELTLLTGQAEQGTPAGGAGPAPHTVLEVVVSLLRALASSAATIQGGGWAPWASGHTHAPHCLACHTICAPYEAVASLLLMVGCGRLGRQATHTHHTALRAIPCTPHKVVASLLRALASSAATMHGGVRAVCDMTHDNLPVLSGWFFLSHHFNHFEFYAQAWGACHVPWAQGPPPCSTALRLSDSVVAWP